MVETCAKSFSSTHRQRVHVGAQCDRASRCVFAPANDADDAGLADAGMHFDAQLAHALGHERRRAVLFEADLGISVQITPQRRQSFVMRKNAAGARSASPDTCPSGLAQLPEHSVPRR